MTPSRHHLLFAVALAAGAFPHATAAQLPPDAAALVTKYVSAFNARDTAQMHALWHPQSLACITPDNQSFYDEALDARLVDPIGTKYTARLFPVDEHNLKALAASHRFPVKPSQELRIEWQQGSDAGSIMVWLVRDDGKLYVDAPCATAQALKEYEADAPEREKRIAATKALADSIPDPLRAELLELLRDHKTGEATRRYKEASKQDYPTSLLVINQLAHDSPR